MLSRAGGLRAALPVTFPPEQEWLVRVMASKEHFVSGWYRVETRKAPAKIKALCATI